MGRLVRFDEASARYARVDLDSADPIWISVAQTGVVVKRSRLGLIGQLIYVEKNLHSVIRHCRVLDPLVADFQSPVTDTVLAPFTIAALISRNMLALRALLALPRLVESGYSSAPEFLVLQEFANHYGTFIEAASKWNLGFAEDLLPLPANATSEILFAYTAGVAARGALSADIKQVLKFAYGHLALALAPEEGRRHMDISERIHREDSTVERDPSWGTVRARIGDLLSAQTAREEEFEARLAAVLAE